MKTYTPDELKEILRLHALYLSGEPGGEKADLSSADFRSANLSSANLRFANLSSADLYSANLRSADLRFADLSSANLHSANLSSANLRFANLRFANLYSANLYSANLHSANLYSANLSSANLSSANLRSANLSESQGLPYAQCSFSGHGERGRQLLGILPDATEYPRGVVLFCGCFTGTVEELREYIANGNEALRGSRNRALEFVLQELGNNPA